MLEGQDTCTKVAKDALTLQRGCDRIMSDKQLYDTDYELWLREQIQALEQGNLAALDISHLVEELEGLNKSNKREMYSYLVILIAHLLNGNINPQCGAAAGKLQFIIAVAASRS